MAPKIYDISALFTIIGGFYPNYEEYLYIENDKIIILKDKNYYEAKLLSNEIYDDIRKLCKKDEFNFTETPMPTDMPTLIINIFKPCKKEIKFYAPGFGNSGDRALINNIYEHSRNVKYKIVKPYIPKTITIDYWLSDSSSDFIELESINFKNENGEITITDTSKINDLLKKLNNLNGFKNFKSNGKFYKSIIKLKIK